MVPSMNLANDDMIFKLEKEPQIEDELSELEMFSHTLAEGGARKGKGKGDSDTERSGTKRPIVTNTSR